MTRWTRTARTALIALTAAASAALLTASPAAAHDNLLQSNPEPDSTVTSLENVELTFSGDLIDFSQSSFAQVQGPDGLYYENSCSTIDLNVLTTPVALGPAGTYTIVWNAVSSDGHPISESYQFQYQPDAATKPAPGWDQPACRNNGTRIQPGAPSPSTAPSPTAGQPTTQQTSPSPSEAAHTPAPEKPADPNGEAFVVLGIVGGVVLLGALIAGAFWLFRSRTRSSRATE
ncbi:copper resistance protein CopC [Microbacterium sp.]|uniref:copper resistance CopC family protein n=1 Tax=unclassified Microbacterium TaxID=2609290 RepID=UPI001AC82765|nr:copper resistance protein CopC [Microbacterium sp.]